MYEHYSKRFQEFCRNYINGINILIGFQFDDKKIIDKLNTIRYLHQNKREEQVKMWDGKETTLFL